MIKILAFDECRLLLGCGLLSITFKKLNIEFTVKKESVLTHANHNLLFSPLKKKYIYIYRPIIMPTVVYHFKMVKGHLNYTALILFIIICIW